MHLLLESSHHPPTLLDINRNTLLLWSGSGDNPALGGRLISTLVLSHQLLNWFGHWDTHILADSPAHLPGHLSTLDIMLDEWSQWSTIAVNIILSRWHNWGNWGTIAVNIILLGQRRVCGWSAIRVNLGVILGLITNLLVNSFTFILLNVCTLDILGSKQLFY